MRSAKCKKILRFFFKYFVLSVLGEKFSGYLLPTDTCIWVFIISRKDLR